jgi:hypothetical protein
MNVRRIAGDGQNPAERATYGANISTGGHLPALCCALHLNAALIHGFDLHCPARPLCARSEERPPRSIPCFCGDGDRSRAELSGRGVRAGRPD